MKMVGLATAAVAAMLAMPVAADETSGQEQASSGGVIDWLANAVGISQSTDGTVEEKKPVSQPDAGKSTGETKPMDIPEESPADKDAYRPDAGDEPR